MYDHIRKNMVLVKIFVLLTIFLTAILGIRELITSILNVSYGVFRKKLNFHRNLFTSRIFPPKKSNSRDERMKFTDLVSQNQQKK